jgi:DNA-binding MarR family transcriptional regulator
LRPRRRRAGSASAKRNGGTAYAMPPTASRPALLDNGSDRRFRALVHDLLTIAARMELVRAHFGRQLGVSGPQYSVLMAIAHLQGEAGVNVGALAQALHVSSAFIATETGKLARRGLILKRTNPDDRRGVLLSLAPGGRLALDRMGAEIRAVNDLFFGALDGKSFAALGATAAALVESSRAAIHYVGAVEKPGAALSAAG